MIITILRNVYVFVFACRFGHKRQYVPDDLYRPAVAEHPVLLRVGAFPPVPLRDCLQPRALGGREAAYAETGVFRVVHEIRPVRQLREVRQGLPARVVTPFALRHVPAVLARVQPSYDFRMPPVRQGVAFRRVERQRAVLRKPPLVAAHVRAQAAHRNRDPREAGSDKVVHPLAFDRYGLGLLLPRADVAAEAVALFSVARKVSEQSLYYGVGEVILAVHLVLGLQYVP